MAANKGTAMDFFKLVQSLDELLYEVVSWLLLYPVTLWRMIRSPIRMMRSISSELAEEEETRFDDVIAPPLFLLLTLILLHGLELGTIGQDRLLSSHGRLSNLIGNDTNLILFGVLIFSTLPLVASVRLTRLRGIHVDKEVLRAPFYAQCYVAGLFALIWNSGILVAEEHLSLSGPAHFAIFGLAIIWLFAVEAKWFAAELKIPLANGARQAAIMIGQWLILLVPVAYVLD